MEKNSSSIGNKTGLIVALVVVIVGLVGAWYWFMYIPEQEAKERARKELVAKKAAAAKKKESQERAAKKKANYDQWIEKADSAFEQELWESAQSSYSEATSLFPTEQYPQDQLLLVNEKLDEIAAKLEGGTVEMVSSATERFYVIVSSSIDGDLAMDSGNKMAAEGNNVKIIEPYGSVRFYRMSLDDYDTREEATEASLSMASDDSVWVLKY